MKNLFNFVLTTTLVALLIKFGDCGVGRQHSGSTSSRQDAREPMTLEELVRSDFEYQDLMGEWVPGSDDTVRVINSDTISHYNVLNGREEVIIFLNNITEQLPNYSNIIFSGDRKYALIEHGKTNIGRVFEQAQYEILDVTEGRLIGQLEAPVPRQNKNSIQYATWSPAGHAIAFVYEHNVYYKADPSPSTPSRQITFDGSEMIYNGRNDFFYQDQVFFRLGALWISKTGKHLAFVKLNDTQVGQFQWPIYGEPGDEETIYPSYQKIHYPKAGTPNPVPEVYVLSLTEEDSSPVQITFPAGTPLHDHELMIAIEMASERELLVSYVNKYHNVSRWYLCDMEGANAPCKLIHVYQLDHGWVEVVSPVSVPAPLSISGDGQRVIFIESVREEGNSAAFKRIVLFNADGDSKTITTGDQSVENILGWDEAGGTIFFHGTFWDGVKADPLQLHIYAVADDGVNRAARCLTCHLTNGDDLPCHDNAAIFSAKFTHFIHKCKGSGVPKIITRVTATTEPVEYPGPTYIDNANLRELLAGKLVPTVRDYSIPVGDNFTASARLLLPADFVEGEKYPVLFTIYGGPGMRFVSPMYYMQWEHTLVSDKKIIVGFIDARGTPGKSTDHLFSVHRRLGVVEMEDQITVIKHLLESESFLDKSKVAIWGWSYGGYATTRVLEMETENVIPCGISVAPFTSWRYYTTLYGGRHMGLPTEDDNLEGYNRADGTSSSAVENLRNKKFLLIHGNADDNTHYQNAMLLSRALQKADILFHTMSYPDEDHAIRGPGMRLHLYHTIEQFLFNECWRNPASHDEL